MYIFSFAALAALRGGVPLAAPPLPLPASLFFSSAAAASGGMVNYRDNARRNPPSWIDGPLLPRYDTRQRLASL